MEAEHECMICGLALNNGAWVCISCERAYELDKPFTQWPAWAKALKDEEQKRRRHNARFREYTILSYEEAGIESLVYGERA